MPKLTKSAESQSTVGYEYVYFDPSLSAVAKSLHLLTDGKGALDLTLQSVFKHAQARGVIRSTHKEN
jgi:hypothetical protein